MSSRGKYGDVREHVCDFGPVEVSRFAGNPHRTCLEPGCGMVSLDLDDEEEDDAYRRVVGAGLAEEARHALQEKTAHVVLVDGKAATVAESYAAGVEWLNTRGKVGLVVPQGGQA